MGLCVNGYYVSCCDSGGTFAFCKSASPECEPTEEALCSTSVVRRVGEVDCVRHKEYMAWVVTGGSFAKAMKVVELVCVSRWPSAN